MDRRTSGMWAALLVGGGLLAGCASPGPPRAPSLYLPDRVSLAAERSGAAVLLRFATPTHTTDGKALNSAVRAGMCRAVGDGPCTATASYPGLVTVSGPLQWVDVLPRDLATGKPRRLSYRVQFFNAAGRTAGWSDAAVTAAGEAPRPVDGLRAEGSRAGIVLRWRADAPAGGEVIVERRSAHAEAAPGPKKSGLPPGFPKGLPGKKAPPAGGDAKTEDVQWLRGEAGAGRGAEDRGGMVDMSASANREYRYAAARSRTVVVDGQTVEMRSAMSPVVEMTLRDVYAPEAPRGLVAAAFGVEGTDRVAVDLVWQPSAEGDVAGYDVYRQSLGEDGSAMGEAEKLNAGLVKLPAFHDATAVHGRVYRYTVRAADGRGNVSEASAASDVRTE